MNSSFTVAVVVWIALVYCLSIELCTWVIILDRQTQILSNKYVYKFL